jgi:5-methylcytosine-specific restriction endonuclease McrA
MKRAPIRRVSKRRAEQLRDYAGQRIIFFSKKPTCEICGHKRSSEVHHTRGRIGAMLLDEQHWMAVCRGCHERIHRAPAWARACGFLF